MKRLVLAFAALGVFVVGCPSEEPPEETPTPSDCDGVFTPPELAIVPIEDGRPTEFPVDVVVQAEDTDGINTVLLYYRTEGVQDFAFVFLTEIPDQENLWGGQIPGGVVREPGVDWYIKATDTAECQAEATLPEDAPKSWLNFKTEVSVFPIPVSENFDSPDCATDLDDLGWTSYTGSFPQAIHAWRADDRRPLSGECSASHSEGIPGGVWECPSDGGGIERDNWLITPALDFTTKESIAVRWFERHQDSGICDELHEVYVSTGSPNPESEDWTLLATDLPFPGSAWQSSAWYDLTEYAGEERVYVALRYLGGSAGRWQVDDFYVGEPLADLELTEPPVLDPSIGPGTMGVELALSVTNVSELFAAPALTATLTTGDDDLAITGASSSLPALGVGESAALDSTLTFDVLASHPDNAYLDFGLLLEDDAGHDWTIPIRLLMGEESFLTVSVTTPTLSELELEVGHGPRVAPNFSLATNSEAQPETEGTETRVWRFNITEHAYQLPPGPGESRWYMEFENDTVWDGAIVESMEFEVGGLLYRPDSLPTTVNAGVVDYIEFPPPPELTVDSFLTSPDPVAPGDTVVLSDIVLRNVGAATAGVVQCLAGSSHPDATNFSTQPTAFGDAPIEAGGTATSDSALGFDVAATHTDNTELPITLVCTDGADTLTPTFPVPVPYPNISFASVRYEDDSGNGDGYADPSETVEVFITLTNDGALPTPGSVTATLTPNPAASTATFTSPASAGATFSAATFEPGVDHEAEVPFTLSVAAGALMGDSMVFDAVYTSDGITWTETVTLEVTGLPWDDCPEPLDPQGDNVGGFDFDIKGCASRSDDTLLQIRLDSYTPYNPATTAVWYFLYEVPTTFSIEHVPPGVDFETGCVTGEDLPNPVMLPTVTSDGMSSTVRLHLDDLDEIGRNVQVGFGVGYCSEINYCDTYPSSAVSWSGGGICDTSGFIPVNW